MTNGTTYNVTCKDVVLPLAAKVGDVAKIAITTTTAEVNVETPVEFTLYDADGIDVTPSIDVDNTCSLTFSGDYSNFNNDKSSEATITMDTVGKKATVKVTYNKNTTASEDLEQEGEIVCKEASAKDGTVLFAQVWDGSVNLNDNVDCAKFYLDGITSSEVSVSEDGESGNLYFCLKDSDGNVISFDSYTVEVGDEDVASVSVSKDSGKYAKFKVTGNKKGTTQLVVTAEKNGAKTVKTIPVKVNEVLTATKLNLSVSRSTMTNADDSNYNNTVTAYLTDKNGDVVAGNFSISVYKTANKEETGTVTDWGTDSNKQYWGVNMSNAADGTYTVEVSGSDNNGSDYFTKKVSFTVQNVGITSESNASLTYKLEANRTTIDENPMSTSDDTAKIQVAAYYNNKFVGYLSSSATGVVIGNSTNAANETGAIKDSSKIVATSGSALSGVLKVTRGGNTYGTNLATTGSEEYLSGAGVIFDAVSGSSITYNTKTKTSDQLASAGTYKVEFIYITQDGKDHSQSLNLTVKNTVVIPTVTISSKNIDSLTEDDILAVLSTNVDMNRETGTSITDIDTTAVTGSSSKIKLDTVTVNDTYTTSVNWYFEIPVNTTLTVK